jgi:Response regulator
MNHIVYIVDEDNDCRKKLTHFLDASGFNTMSFHSAEIFLKHNFADLPSCVVLETLFRRLSGFEVCDIVRETTPETSLIFLTSNSDIYTAVSAIKGGAYDFLTKPFNEEHLHESIQSALAVSAANLDSMKECNSLKNRYMSLTPREYQVLNLVLDGNLNKQIASKLGISEVTVKVHRRRIMFKMQSQSVAELARDVERLGRKCTLFNRNNLY